MKKIIYKNENGRIRNINGRIRPGMIRAMLSAKPDPITAEQMAKEIGCTVKAVKREIDDFCRLCWISLIDTTPKHQRWILNERYGTFLDIEVD